MIPFIRQLTLATTATLVRMTVNAMSRKTLLSSASVQFLKLTQELTAARQVSVNLVFM